MPTVLYGIVHYDYAWVTSMDQLTWDMMTCDGATYATSETTIVNKSIIGYQSDGKTGNVIPEGCWCYIAIKKSAGWTAKQDNGFGTPVNFLDDNFGVNGIDVIYNGVEYKLFGEYAVISQKMYIYVGNY